MEEKILHLYINKANYASDYAYSIFKRRKTLTVEKNNQSFIMFDGIPELYTGIEEEKNPEIRFKNAVTIRNRGKNRGELYIYKKDSLPSRSHDVIGNIKGDFDFREGEEVKFEVYPERIMTIGISQGEAEEILNRRGIEQERGGEISEESIIIEQKPMYTVSILKRKKLLTIGIHPERIMDIKLYPEAKKTLYYFNFASFMSGNSVGKLKVSKRYKSFILFASHASEYKNPILPENNPTFSKKYSIGISNMASRNKGSIGIRLKESEKYGQTGENPKDVNLIGEVIRGRKLLEDIKEGEEVYFRVKGQIPF